jgi:hypothetical protein
MGKSYAKNSRVLPSWNLQSASGDNKNQTMKHCKRWRIPSNQSK